MLAGAAGVAVDLGAAEAVEWVLGVKKSKWYASGWRKWRDARWASSSSIGCVDGNGPAWTIPPWCRRASSVSSAAAVAERPRRYRYVGPAELRRLPRPMLLSM